MDVRRWNLGLVAGVGACGPLVPLPAETDGDDAPDDDDDDTGIDPTVTTATDTIDTGCGECPPGYSCIDGRCEYECHSCCLGECGGYYDCFSHDDCPDYAYCNYYSCVTIPYLYDCSPGLQIIEDLIPDVGGAWSLAFVDTDGDAYEDFAVLGGSTAWVVRVPWATASVPVALPSEGTGSVVGTDLDGAPPDEITFALTDLGRLLTMRVVDEPEIVALSEPWLTSPVSGDFDADGLDDIAGLTDTQLMVSFSDGMQFGDASPLREVVGPPLAVGEVGSTPGDDIVFASGHLFFVDVGAGAFSMQLDEMFAMAVRTPVVGDFNGDGLDDVAAIGDRGGYYGLIATWLQTSPGVLGRQPYAAGPNLEPHPEEPYFVTAVGDFDADGSDDVVVGGSNRLTVLFGAVGGSGFSCWAELPIAGTARVVAAGNHDGVGGDEIVWSDGETSTHVLTVG